MGIHGPSSHYSKRHFEYSRKLNVHPHVPLIVNDVRRKNADTLGEAIGMVPGGSGGRTPVCSFAYDATHYAY